ncbi:uncharacterized protein LOC107264249 isoform X2 [Cephus cinctus]|uniref:RING-type E3 ubiquitin transferase n=1 Tax=Cephus cinctus TaxID=211228 RepID=A0AAJ7VXR2_CEPCN|nr:uncharacterized protein LOC107264249 isoform X2 [Cephus cinctus]
MATYLKRTSKLFDLSLSRASGEVNLRDLMCPVCRGILIEPVTLPCTHSLCLRCLKGTFEHNSLSCPLCRVRVGSWLRTATKSETLVNSGLWEFIRTRFPKEVEGKHNGDEEDIELDSGFRATNKILSAAGEIRREYEAQLQMAEEEMRRKREAERIASEVLIRKIQAEEQQRMAQLAQDQLLAKTLAKKQVAEKNKTVTNYHTDNSELETDNSMDESKPDIKLLSLGGVQISQVDGSGLEDEKPIIKCRDGTEPRKSNIALISKIRVERYASSMKAGASSIYKTSPDKFCCQKSMPIHNAVTRTLKHQAVPKLTQLSSSNYISEPGCSGSKIYSMQSKEELHVPDDVLNSKKKSLGVEVCMTAGDDDERIGSAESAGSHDSINQEIHHFKPIKAMPRTPLKISSGKTRQDLKTKQSPTSEESVEMEITRKPSTSLLQSQSISNKLVKSHVSDTVRRLDLASELSFDSNKNYTKPINKIINGTKVSKKLILDEGLDAGKVNKTWKSQVRNGILAKSRRRKNSWADRKDPVYTLDSKDLDEENEEFETDKNFTCSSERADTYPSDQPELSEDDTAVENIAERIKNRKVNHVKEVSPSIQNPVPETEPSRRSTRRKRGPSKTDIENTIYVELSENSEVKSKRKNPPKSGSKAKRQRVHRTTRVVIDSSTEMTTMPRKSTRMIKQTTKRTTRNARKNLSADEVDKKPSENTYDILLDNCNDPRSNGCSSQMTNVQMEVINDDNTNSPTDDDVIKEQENMERLLLQEMKDFKLACRLQAKFDEMERIAGRTRGSRRALESENIELGFYPVDIGRSINELPNVRTANQSRSDQTTRSHNKQRRRPQRRALK